LAHTHRRPPPTSASARPHHSYGHAAARSQLTNCPARAAASGGSSSPSWMLCCPRPTLRSGKGWKIRAQRFKTGSVVFDRRRKTWNFLDWVNGKRSARRIGTLAEYPNKSAARRAAQNLQPATEVPKQKPTSTVNALIASYRTEKKCPNATPDGTSHNQKCFQTTKATA
jgi:hypothetical protein